MERPDRGGQANESSFFLAARQKRSLVPIRAKNEALSENELI